MSDKQKRCCFLGTVIVIINVIFLLRVSCGPAISCNMDGIVITSYDAMVVFLISIIIGGSLVLYSLSYLVSPIDFEKRRPVITTCPKCNSSNSFVEVSKDAYTCVVCDFTKKG